ncbi:integrase [Microvirga ossetica]|uniref:Integrase n=1 Tax=Microvirga ossetica TaxID=1882682 RepID=A0A1B2EA14_9HYPH|nr:site-specific integrase [Microvirga ossetica]ANY76814.1 integrase [Microvirga ossetica]
MATRTLHRLSARGLQGLSKGKHSDGGNLFLRVDASGARRWSFIYALSGKERELGLGSLRDVSLAKARERAAEMRSLLTEGRDPAVVRAAETPATPSFGAFADSLLQDIEGQWRNEKHRSQWRMTLTKYAAPLRDKPVDAITTKDVLSALRPLWGTKPETGNRLRGRIERVLAAARARGHIAGPWSNPAAWRGHLDQLLPARRTLSRGHHKAMPYAAVPDFMALLAEQDGIGAKALAFTIQTAARTGEVIGMRWSEVDLEARVWTVPAARMKTAKAHRVPLSEPALEILKRIAQLRDQDEDGDSFVFPGAKLGKPLSNMALGMCLRRLEIDATVHGFRSSFRVWAAEATSYPHDVCELALAHTVGDRVVAAYKRTDLLEQRRGLMDAWCRFIQARTGIVSLARIDRAAPAA